ncbi:hypothetical protein Vafri_21577, partial [Volvox africanus]
SVSMNFIYKLDFRAQLDFQVLIHDAPRRATCRRPSHAPSALVQRQDYSQKVTCSLYSHPIAFSAPNPFAAAQPHRPPNIRYTAPPRFPSQPPVTRHIRATPASGSNNRISTPAFPSEASPSQHTSAGLYGLSGVSTPAHFRDYWRLVVRPRLDDLLRAASREPPGPGFLGLVDRLLAELRSAAAMARHTAT